jgi:predicted nucleic acid-binding protein
MKVFLDTSVIVASLVSEHPHHERAMGVVRRILDGKDEGSVAAHGVAETYAVLTTLPVSPRIGPETAHKLIAENVLRQLEVVALTASEYGRLLAALPERGVVGGTTYDALQLACAEKSGAVRIYTFNTAHFKRIGQQLAGKISAP